jgi:hypothetical protein
MDCSQASSWSRIKPLREEHEERVFENRLLKKMFGPKMVEVTRVCENCIARSFMVCTAHQILFGYPKKQKVLGVWVIWQVRREDTQDFGAEISRKETTRKTQT